MQGTTEAVNAQKFESFDIKLGNGWRYSFERRGKGEDVNIKVLEGKPGQKRKYIATLGFGDKFPSVPVVIHSEQAPENEAFYNMALAFLIMVRPNLDSNAHFWKQPK